MYGILLRQLFFVASVLYSGSWDFLYGRCKQLFVITYKYCLFLQTFILKQCLSGYVLHNSLLHLLFKNGGFLNTDISQGSVATRLGCGGVFIYYLVTNFLLSLTVKKFWKSVNIWWSYGQEFGVLFFWLTVYKAYSAGDVCVFSIVCIGLLYNDIWLDLQLEIVKTDGMPQATYMYLPCVLSWILLCKKNNYCYKW